MKDSNIKWLYEELPKMVSKNVITEDTLAQIHEYYGNVEETNGLKIMLAIFGTLGAVLIGSGIILVFAKNWDNFSITIRTVLSLLPLILGQVLVGWVVIRDKDSLAWREGTAAFLFLAIGASISLISQTYHIPGDTSQFVLAWLLLSVPIVYLLKATVPAVFYIFGIVVWAGFTRGQGGYTLFYWLLLALMGGFLYEKFKQNRVTNSSIFLLWSLGISVCISLGIVFEHQLPGLWMIAYSSYFTLLYLLRRNFSDQAEFTWQKPLAIIGMLGSLILSFMLTYGGFWDRIGWKFYGQNYHYNTVNSIQDYVLVALLVVGAGYLIYKSIKRREGLDLIFSLVPIMTITGFIIASFRGSGYSELIFDVYLLILGIYIVTHGIKNHSLGLANGGMLIIAVLIVLRFFDSDLGFLEKGIAFILVGSGFLLANNFMVRRQKGGLR